MHAQAADLLSNSGLMQLGFIGLGRMGFPMARRLLAAGHPMVVYDVNRAAVEALVAQGARPAEDVAEVAAQAEAVFVCLPTPALVKQVAAGPDGVISGGKVRYFIDLSTTGSLVAAEVSARLAETRNIMMLDAPVSGGETGAASGKLTVMVSGPRHAFNALRPILEQFGKLFFCAEKAGAAQTLKLVNNLLSITALGITSEAVAMGVKAGLDPTIMLEVINESSGRNTATADKFPRTVLTGSFDFGHSASHALKDLRLCLDEGEALGVPMGIGNSVRHLLNVTEATFGGDADFTCMAKVLEQWAGIKISR